jgi:hypothetical protein
MTFKNLLLGLALLASPSFAQNTLQTSKVQQLLNANAPRNYIKNSGAEDNILNITNASSIVTQNAVSVLEGDADYLVDATGSAQKVIFQAADFQVGLLGGSCEATAYYRGDASLYKVYATLAGTTVSTETTLLNTNGAGVGSQMVSVIFPCGQSGADDPAFVVESTSASAAAIQVDSIYLGQALSVSSIAQAYEFGTLTYAATAGCSWANAVTTTTPGTYAIDAQCPDPTATGRVTAPGSTGNRVPAFKIPAGSPSGVYEITATGYFFGQRTGTTVNNFFSFYNGTSLIGAQVSNAGIMATTAATGIPMIFGSFSYTSQSTDMTVEIRGSSSAGSSSGVEAISNPLIFSVKYFPSSSQVVVRGDVTNIMVQAGGTPTGSLTDASATIWGTETRDTTSSYNPSTGEFTAPFEGDYCWAAAVFSTATFTAGQIVGLIPYVDGTGLTRGAGVTRVDASSGTGHESKSIACTYLSRSQVLTFRTNNTGTGPSFTSSNANSLTIWNESQGQAKPYIPSSVFFSRPGVVKKGFTQLNCDSGSAITSNPDNMVASIANIGTGACVVTLTTGFFNSINGCVISRQAAAQTSDALMRVNASSTTSVTIGARTDAGVDSTAFDVYMECTGE